MTMKNCQECGKEISSKSEKCPQCSAPTALKILWGKWFILTAMAFCLIGYMKNPEAQVKQKKPPTIERSNPARQLTLTYTWTLGGFGNIMLLKDVTIFNPTTITMKDALIRCSLYAASGTHLGDVSAIVYQPLAARVNDHLGEAYIEEMNMGFVNSQAAKASCSIVNAITP